MPHPKRSRVRTRTARAAVATLTLVWLLAASGCGQNVQTLQPYTPADGVNADTSAGEVQIRNLMVLTRTEGEGFLSATLTGETRDALTSVTGSMIDESGETTELTVTQRNPITFSPGELLVLTDREFITMTGTNLRAGLTAELVLQFSTAGEVRLQAPVLDATSTEYRTVTPSPLPPATAE